MEFITFTRIRLVIDNKLIWGLENYTDSLRDFNSGPEVLAKISHLWIINNSYKLHVNVRYYDSSCRFLRNVHSLYDIHKIYSTHLLLDVGLM